MTSHYLRFAVNRSIMFPDLPVLDRAVAASDAGFTAVEFEPLATRAAEAPTAISQLLS